MTLCPAGVLDRIAGPNWTSTLCRIGVPHASVLNALVFSSARDFAAGATEALRWTYELCRVGVLHGSVLNALVFTGARLCGRRYQRQSSPLALRRTKIFHSHLLTTQRGSVVTVVVRYAACVSARCSKNCFFQEIRFFNRSVFLLGIRNIKSQYGFSNCLFSVAICISSEIRTPDQITDVCSLNCKYIFNKYFSYLLLQICKILFRSFNSSESDPSIILCVTRFITQYGWFIHLYQTIMVSSK